jgi:hypothetical protein
MSASSRFQWKQLLILVLLSLWLASCQWISPVNTQPTHTQNVAGKGDFSLLAANPQTGQMITMPSQVIKQPLQALEQPPTGKHFRLHLSSKASNKGANKGQNKTILMPEQGSFELVVQSGPKFEVLDTNASDGQAIVQLPTSHYLALLKLHGQHTRTQKRSLQLEDNLYYLSHELQRSAQGKGSFQILAQAKAKKLELTPLCSSDPEQYRLWKVHNPNSSEIAYDWQLEGSEQTGQEVAPPGDSVLETDSENGSNKLLLSVDNKRQDSAANKGNYCDPEEAERSLWWQLGSRALPVPSNWKSSDGEKYVLRLKNEGVTDLTFRWYKTPNQAVALPPGTAEIGPAGGTVELPGVAKLEIPAGALGRREIIRLSQEITVADRSIFPKIDPSRPLQFQWFERLDYMSPVVKIEPLGLKLNQAASLILPGKDEEALSKIYQNIFFILETQDINADNFDDFLSNMSMLSQMYNRPITIRDPIIVKEFGYIAKMKFHDFNLIEGDEGFRTQSQTISSCNDALLNYSVTLQKGSATSAHFTMEISGFARPVVSDDQICKVMATFERVYELLTSPSESAGPQNKLTLHPTLQKNIAIYFRDKVMTAPDKEIYGGHVLKCTEGRSTCQNYLVIPVCPDIDLNTTACSLNEQKILEIISHELFHYFQSGYVLNANYYYPNESALWHETWFIEGTASWFSQKFAETQAVKLGFNTFKIEDMIATSHLAHESKRSIATPFLEEIQDQRKYAYHGFFSLFDEQIVYDAVRNFVEDYGKEARFEIDRSTLSLDKSLKTHDESKDISHFYAQYGKNALLMSNILPVEKFKYDSKNKDYFHVDIIKPEPWNQITGGTYNQTHPAKFEIEIDSTQTKYYQLLPHASNLSGSQQLVTYIESINPEEINGLKVKDYLGIHILGLDNSEGIAVDLEDDFSFRRHNTGDFQSLINPEKNDRSVLENFDPTALNKSAILSISNGLWPILPSKVDGSHPPIKVTIAAYIQPFKLTSVKPEPYPLGALTPLTLAGEGLDLTKGVLVQPISPSDEASDTSSSIGFSQENGNLILDSSALKAGVTYLVAASTNQSACGNLLSSTTCGSITNLLQFKVTGSSGGGDANNAVIAFAAGDPNGGLGSFAQCILALFYIDDLNKAVVGYYAPGMPIGSNDTAVQQSLVDLQNAYQDELPPELIVARINPNSRSSDRLNFIQPISKGPHKIRVKLIAFDIRRYLNLPTGTDLSSVPINILFWGTINYQPNYYDPLNPQIVLFSRSTFPGTFGHRQVVLDQTVSVDVPY